MKKRKTTLRTQFWGVLLGCLLVFGFAADVKAETVPTSAWDLAAELNVGWNLGNTLENQSLSRGFLGKDRFDAMVTWTGNTTPTKELIQAVADRGFTAIRIPVSFYNHLLESEPRTDNGDGTYTYHPGTTVDPDWLARVKEVVDWSLDAGMYVVINDHHDTSMWMSLSWIFADADDIDAQDAQLMNIWRQYAAYFKDYDHRLIFQSMGEIVNRERSFSAAECEDFRTVHQLNQSFIDTVRATGGKNVDRFLMLPTYASNSGPLFVDESFCVPYRDSADDKLLFCVHNYSLDEEELAWTFATLYNRAVRYDMPFAMDEAGAMLTEDQATRERVSYTLTNLAAKYGMGLFIWDAGAAEHAYIDRPKTMATGEIAYVTRWTDKNGTVYETDSEKAVAALFRGKAEAQPLTAAEREQILDDSLKSVALAYLNRGNVDKVTAYGNYFTYGTYSQIDEKASNPVTLYMPTPKNYACLYPYIEAQSFEAILPEGITITLRELDREGKYIGPKYVSKTGARYTPSANAVYAAVCFRATDSNVTFADYRRWIQGGELELYPVAGERFRLTGIDVTTPPTRAAYEAGETFNSAGMVVTATYNDGSSATVTDYRFTPTAPLTAADRQVTITYSEGGVTATATQAISVASVYPIATLPASNGDVTATPTAAKAGDTVKVTLRPQAGYETDEVTVTTESGKAIAAVKAADGSYTFTMVAEKVTVAATFRAIAVVHDCPSKHLKDVDINAWYHPYIDAVVSKNLMTGVAADRFAPNATTDRAMIVTILYRLEGSPAVATTAPFSDVPTGQWYTAAVAWANAKGVVTGYGNGRFGPKDRITREQLAAILYRYAQYKGYDVSATADLSRYADAGAIGGWALTAMKWANAEELITGRTETTLAPRGNATRAEVAAILVRFLEKRGS